MGRRFWCSVSLSILVPLACSVWRRYSNLPGTGRHERRCLVVWLCVCADFFEMFSSAVLSVCAGHCKTAKVLSVHCVLHVPWQTSLYPSSNLSVPFFPKPSVLTLIDTSHLAIRRWLWGSSVSSGARTWVAQVLLAFCTRRTSQLATGLASRLEHNVKRRKRTMENRQNKHGRFLGCETSPDQALSARPWWRSSDMVTAQRCFGTHMVSSNTGGVSLRTRASTALSAA